MLLFYYRKHSQSINMMMLKRTILAASLVTCCLAVGLNAGGESDVPSQTQPLPSGCTSGRTSEKAFTNRWAQLREMITNVSDAASSLRVHLRAHLKEGLQEQMGSTQRIDRQHSQGRHRIG